jgi:hypothetical protein
MKHNEVNAWSLSHNLLLHSKVHGPVLLSVVFGTLSGRLLDSRRCCLRAIPKLLLSVRELNFDTSRLKKWCTIACTYMSEPYFKSVITLINVTLLQRLMPPYLVLNARNMILQSLSVLLGDQSSFGKCRLSHVCNTPFWEIDTYIVGV